MKDNLNDIALMMSEPIPNKTPTDVRIYFSERETSNISSIGILYIFVFSKIIHLKQPRKAQSLRFQHIQDTINLGITIQTSMSFCRPLQKINYFRNKWYSYKDRRRTWKIQN